MKQHWLVKQEPSAYSWKDFVADGKTAWTGVRNYQARNNLQAMRKGDAVLFYHSVSEKAVVGLARVVRNAYPDPTSDDPRWVCVDLEPVRPFTRPVTLERMKAEPALEGLLLFRHTRLSVMPVPPEAFQVIDRMGRMAEDL